MLLRERGEGLMCVIIYVVSLPCRQVRATTLKLIAELAEWIDSHHDVLGTVQCIRGAPSVSQVSFSHSPFPRSHRHSAPVHSGRAQSTSRGDSRSKGCAECVPEVQRQNGPSL